MTKHYKINFNSAGVRLLRRETQKGADVLSRRIWDTILALPQFIRARTVMTYLDIGSESPHPPYLPELWRLGKKLVVPYCVARELRSVSLEKHGRIEPRNVANSEPKPEWRERAERHVDTAELDLIVVPGLAFDRYGGRLGLGKGYYDRFLPHIRPDAVKIAPAFECQLVDKIPLLPHDVRVDMVVTENAVYKTDISICLRHVMML